MLNSKPLIKLFKTNNNNYIYDVNKNTVLNITNNQYSFLENCMKDDKNDYIESEEISKLYKEGFLSTNKAKEIVHPADELLEFYLDNSVKMLTLQITQQCNFRCEYCVYSGSYLNRGHSNKKMSFETAKKGIDFLINHSKNHDEINIGFYGGEPLLEFNFIKQCVEYAEEKADGKEIRFSMTTNGSLLTEKVVEFLYKHNLELTISLDGPKKIHDDHRKLASNNCGSFDKVISNIKNIEKKYPEYINNIIFNAVIDVQNDFSCIDKFFLDYETVKDIALISSLISDNYKKTDIDKNEDYYVKQEYELFRIFYNLLKKKSIKNCSKIVIEDYNEILKLSKKLIPQKRLPDKTHPSGPCIPGTQRLFMDVDGFFYPCEKVSESSEIMQIGHVDRGFDTEKVRYILNIGKVNDESCKKCWAIRFCGICAALIDNTENKFSKIKKEEFCKKTKLVLEERFKNYCVLKEFGHNFEENEKMTLFK